MKKVYRLLDRKHHLDLAESENPVSSSARIHPSLEFPSVEPHHPLLPLPLSSFFSLFLALDSRPALSYLYFHLLCIPWGITRPSVHHVSPSLRLLRVKSTCSVVAVASLGSFYGFPRRENGRANSFKSRCGPGNSANPLRIHRAPLANSSLAPNIFLSARHPFTRSHFSTALSSSPTHFSTTSSYFVLSHRTLRQAFRLL